ncbi:hypothetical protein GCM10009629_28450 [Pseudonocardia alni]
MSLLGRVRVRRRCASGRVDDLQVRKDLPTVTGMRRTRTAVGSTAARPGGCYARTEAVSSMNVLET